MSNRNSAARHRVRDLTLPVMVACLLVACGGGSPGDTRAEAAEAATVPAEAAGAGLTESEQAARIAAALAEDDALLRADAMLYEQRRAAMADQASCLAQAEGISGEARRRIEEACQRLPN